ncbi:MAG TPA: sulfate ABC transporter substrate-binding protein [Candidatus Binatia bacterium]
MRRKKEFRLNVFKFIVAVVGAFGFAYAAAAETKDLLNVSYDPTRELWREINAAFIPHYKEKTGTDLSIKMSHGGSGSQARAVIDGLDADVVTLAIASDVDAIAKAGLIAPDWRTRLPNNASAYNSTIVFVVRKGNPKGIKDWPDLIKEGVQVITPNPKTSGNGQLSLWAAWGSVTQRGGTEEEAAKFVTELYKHVPVLDAGARGSTTTFVQKKIGDVHLTWENEAHLEVKEAGGEVEIVYPPISILADPPLAWVDANVKRKGTEEVAKAYLEFLYTPQAQEIIGKHFYRPTDPAILAQFKSTLPPIELFPITAIAESWSDAKEKFFADGKIFDQIYKPK